jgi:hypothetical protein
LATFDRLVRTSGSAKGFARVAAFPSRRPIAKALNSVTPGILLSLGTIPGILIAFLAVRVWANLDHARDYVGREVSSLREVVMLANFLCEDVSARVREAIGKTP